jgi:hypothetical protein
VSVVVLVSNLGKLATALSGREDWTVSYLVSVELAGELVGHSAVLFEQHCDSREASTCSF